ncbi:MAG TPA: tetratricopeptide repeat protein, partial [Anaeromyxobacteraceae bacterium]|nr:tetratricopeptide repeat protein [Anaeromyxobacteraceae bacterium]
MAEGKTPSSAAQAAAGASRGGGFELRLERARAFVCLSDRPVVPGLRLVELAMEVPDVRFPFDVGQGAAQFRRRLCDLARVELSVEPEFLLGLSAGLDLSRSGLASLQIGLRAGFAEAGGRLEGGVPFTCKLGLEPEGDQAVALVIYEARLYGPAAVPAAALPSLLARAAAGLSRQEGAALVVEPFGLLLRRIVPARGWKLPRASAARLSRISTAPGEVRLAWDRAHAGPAEAPSDPDRLAALEGARAFREAEALVARGEWDAAREAYLAAGAAAATHPFAGARLLSLLSVDEGFHDEALDLSAHWLSRRPDFAPALLAEGVLRARRGERDRSARAFAELSASSARRGEELGALFAADACFALGPDSDAPAFSRAVEVALSLRRDHLPALRALRALAERTGDREALLRASRRLAAYAPDEAEKAGAHARLAEMLLQSDPPSARLHLDQALRLAPDDAAALAALARACELAGEWLRAARAHDRLRELFLARGDAEAAAREALAVGALWEERLGHPENALLRYREACELSGASGEARERAARTAHALGHWAEAADHYAGLLGSLDPREPGAAERAARAHAALARVAEERLSDLPRAATHLESSLSLVPHDAEALSRLAALYRTMSRPAELLGALDRLAPLTRETAVRVALLAEAGDTCLGPLSLPDAARSRYGAALALDPQCRPALEGMARIAHERGDALAERDLLSRLVLAASDPAEQAATYDRLAAAAERAGDLESASRAAASARRAEPSLPRLREAARIARLAADGGTLAELLAELAAASRAAGDAPAAAAAWLERAALLGASSPAQAMAALHEARALSPGDPQVLAAQADLAEASGDFSTAFTALRALLAGGAEGAPGLELRAARAAHKGGDLRAAREHAQRALDLETPGAAALLEEVLEGSDDHSARALLAERTGRLLEAARLWELAGQPERMRAALEQAARDPAAPEEALRRLAEARLAAGDRGDAAEVLSRLAARREGAERSLLARRALELDPDFAPALRLRLADAGEPPAPAERAQLLARLASSPDLPPEEAAAALAERARLLASGEAPGGPSEALIAARRWVALAPRQAAALDLLAEVSSAAGDAAGAARALLERAEVARQSGEEEPAVRLVAAGHAALASGLHDEGEQALGEALRLGLDREEARAAWAALAERARARGDAPSERAALAALVPLVPTGKRPGLLTRLAGLQLEAGDLGESRTSAEEARTLAPRDLAALEACRAAAERQGDLSAVAVLLAEMAELDPERAGERLLTRARLLAGPLADPVGADRGYGEALARLPPQYPLAAEQARLRRDTPALRDLPWGEPLERLALRLPDQRAAAQAFRDAAVLALSQDDGPAAVRSARRAWSRTRDEPGFAGPLLARVLYLRGGGAEALVLHHGLFQAGFPGIDEGEAAVLCRQLAELAEDSGDGGLALEALDRLLELRPQDLEAAEWRFRLDPDRRRAALALADVAGATRSARRRARALALAADSAHRQLADPALADALWRRARQAAADTPALLAEVETVRLEAARRDHDPAAPRLPEELVDALHDAAQAWQAAGEAGTARTLLEEAVELLRRHGRAGDAAADLRRLEDLAAGQKAAPVAAAYARDAAKLHRERGDLGAAEQALRRAVAHHRGDVEAWGELEALALELGKEGVPLLGEALAARGERAQGTARAEALTGLARLLSGPLGEPERALAALRGALAADPAFEPAQADLEALLRSLGRAQDLARLLLARAASSDDPARRVVLRREAAEALEGLPDEASRALAAEALAAALSDAPDDPEIARLLSRLLVSLGRREEAVPLLAALVRADPEDEESAGHLAAAWSSRHHERAQLFRARAAAATGATRAQRLREAAKALFAAGEDVEARGLLREAFDAWPADDGAFLAAVRDAAADIDRLDHVLSARARAMPAEAAGCHRARADALLAFGRAADALEAYEACLAVSPDDGSALAMIAEVRAQQGRDEAAAEADGRLLALAEKSPGSVPESAEARARYRLGLAAWARGRPDEGTAHLSRALSLAPNDERAGIAWAALASGHAARGDGDSALAAARRRVERAAELGLAAERREALEAGAALAAQFGDRGADAAGVLEGLTALRLADAGAGDPGLDSVFERAISSLLRLGENARAEALIALAARHAEGHRRAELLGRIADAAQARGDRAAAREARAGAFDAEPAVELDAARLEALERSGDPGALAQALEHALAAGIGDPAVLTAKLARTRALLGDPWGAAQAWEALVARGPAAPEYHEAIRELELHHQRSGDARALAADLTRRARESENPGERARLWLEAAQALERGGAEPAEVRSALEQACDADPDEAAPWRSVAAHEGRRGDSVAAARAHLAVAIRTEGDEAARAALEAARIFESIGRPADSARAYAAVLHARPGSWRARRALAARSMEKGDPVAAAEHLAAVDPMEVPPADELEFLRSRAQAFSAAGREAEAMEGFREVFQADPGDEVAFDHLAPVARATGRAEPWLELAARHDAALAASGNAARRRDLRCQRARLFEEMGRLEAAEGAWRAALEIDPDFQPAREALEALAGRSADWAAAAAKLGREAERTAEPAEAAALWLRRGRMLLERTRDPGEAAASLARAAARADEAPGLPAAARLAAEARALLDALAPVAGPGAEAPPPAAAAPEPAADPVAELLRAQAETASGPERAELYERLAGHLERAGARAGAGAALLSALEADPGRDLTFAWFLSLAEGDRQALERGHRLRVGAPSDEPARAAALADLGAFLAEDPARQGEAQAALEEALAIDPGSLPAAEALARLPAQAAPPAPEPAPEPPPAEPPAVEPPQPLDLAEALSSLEPLEFEDLGEARADLGEAAEAAAPPEPPGPGEPSLEPPLLELVEEPVDAPPEGSTAPGQIADLPPLDLAVAFEDAEVEGLAVPEPGDPARRLHAQARARGEAGEVEAAYQLLREARALDPADLGIMADLAWAAEAMGYLEEAVELSERLADAVATADPAGAAQRYRECAAVVRDRVGDLDRAAALLEKAASLRPEDESLGAELAALRARREEAARPTLSDLLERARRDPADLTALQGAASLCRQQAASASDPAAAALLLERARAAEGLSRFLSPGLPAAESPPLASRLPPEVRARVAVPGAEG